MTNLKSDIAAIKELRQIEKDVKPDVIHLHSSVAGGLGRLAYKGKNNTVVYTPHGYAHILMGPGKKSKIYKFAEKVLGNKALTLTCCESEDEEAKKFSRRTAYVETGVNLADLSASLDGIEPVKNDKFTVFTLGRACVQKQPQLFNKIAELVPEAQFIWIGNGELENELTAPNIEVTGWKPRKEALAMAKGADAFILCSLGEAIAMSLIENMYIKKLILVLAAKNVIKTPFIVIDADDYYGKEGFKAVHEYLVNGGKSCMAGFVLKNTLSDNGGVTRGICKMNDQNNLTEVVETKNIVKTATGAEADGVVIDVDALVSMNMWGLTPDFLGVLEEGFKEFFEKEVPGNPLKAEYLIPSFIGELLEQGKMSVKVLRTNDTWYGMTYHEDVAAVKDSFKKMLEKDVYKDDLFSDFLYPVSNIEMSGTA